MQIKNRYTGHVIFESKYNTMKEAIREALNSDADLRGAYLRDAYLRDAYLSGAQIVTGKLFLICMVSLR